MKIEIENLSAQMRGLNLTLPQKGQAINEFDKLVEYVEKLESNLIENRVIASEHTEGSSANGAVAENYNKAIDDSCAIFSNTIAWCIQQEPDITKHHDIKKIYEILQKTKNDVISLKKATTSL
jgi:hypothetical protein